MEQDFVKFQAEHHPLVQSDEFESMEEYCLHLIHLKAYEEVAALGREKVVLDLGCNNGYGTRIIAGSARRVVGVDVSETAVAEARRTRRGGNISFLSTGGDKLPFANGEFDIVCSCQVIEHVDNYHPYLSEIIRVLKDGGTAVFTTPNARIRLDPGMKPWFEFHVREFSAAELGDLLRQWFPQVQVKGLSATKELYQVEYRRVQRSRQRARSRAKALFPPYIELRAKFIGAVKSMLPHRLVTRVQGELRKLAATRGSANASAQPEHAVLDPTELSRFSTRDLYYSEANVDEALDLLAICHKGAGT